MIPQDLQYPEFVADQLLTSDNLNDLFNYLDIQDRLTRTNLIGIGIVCGLELITAPDGTSITITKGTGVTSQGHLATIDESVFSRRIDFDAEKETYYDKFLNAAHTKRFDLWELKKSAAVEGATDLDLAFLSGNGVEADSKIVLLYVELLKIGNKNCNPNSCDEKGVNVHVNIRPLLIRKEDAINFGFQIGNSYIWNNSGENSLQEIRMRRFDVPNTYPVTTQDVFKAYQDILNESFLDKVEEALSKAYDNFSGYILNDYPTNPFSGLSSDFAKIHNGNITAEELVFIQYYYDLFSDFILAYKEFFKVGNQILNECCPDEDLFPRHLLLGEAVGYHPDVHSDYRYYFLYSPLFERKNLLQDLRLLFKKLVLLKEHFFIPPPSFGKGTNKADFNIRITPSKHGDILLSEKSIPYYYKVNDGASPLFQYWDPAKTRSEIAKENLSYHADQYNTADDFVLNPLHYDIEPYNFLRVEGHIGKDYKSVLHNIKRIISDKRLPIDVIAVKTGKMNIDTIDFSLMESSMSDLELAYDIARREWEAIVGKAIEWLNLNQGRAKEFVNSGRLVQFIVMLQKGKKFMVESLPPFIMDYREFIVLYEKIEHEAELIREKLFDKEENSSNENNSNFIEDITDQLDEVIHAAKKGPFRNIYQEFVRRAKDVYGYQYLNYYLEKNPGIQHKAGTTVGGTLLLVYHQNNKESKNGRFNKEIREYEPDEAENNSGREYKAIPGYEKELYLKAGSADPGKAKKYLVGDIEKDYYQMEKSELTILMDQIREMLENGVIHQNPSLDNLVQEIEEGTVIADFYLPFMCSSTHPCIQYVIPDTKATEVSLSLQANKATGTLEYSSDDENKYLFTASPAEGTLEPMDGATEETETETEETEETVKLFFHPTKLVDKLGENSKIEKTYVYIKGEGKSEPVPATVYHKPEAIFTIEKNAAGAYIIVNKSKFATRYLWNFGNGVTSDDETPEPALIKPGIEITLSVINTIKSACDETQQTVDKPIQKTCTDITKLHKSFKNFIQDPKNDRFSLIFYQKERMNEFVEKQDGILNKSSEEQLEFYLHYVSMDKNLQQLLEMWLGILNEIILKEPDPGSTNGELNFRSVAIHTYHYLINIILHISCIHSEDIDKFQFDKIFEIILQQINAILKIQELSAFDKKSIGLIGVFFIKEKTSQELNNSFEQKPLYTQKLIDLTTLFEHWQ